MARRLTTREEILAEELEWEQVPAGSGLWETSWEDTVGVVSVAIMRVVSVRAHDEEGAFRRGIVDVHGECRQPYKCLASWEEGRNRGVPREVAAPSQWSSCWLT